MRLELLGVSGPAWVQDLGRPGRMIEGIPPGGALVPEALVEANRAVGNRGGAPGIEAFGELIVAARGGDATLWWGEPVRLERDHVRRLPARGLTYLAVQGGLILPEVLGGHGLLVTAGLGGGGRPLRAGDGFDVGGFEGEERGHSWQASGPIRLVRGPDLGEEAWEVLVGTEWTVGSADRTGCRLVGGTVPGDGGLRATAPMVRGAIQVTPSGEPVVLGPDHPTTGGYPVVGVVIAADQGRLAGATRVRFTGIGVDEARRERARWRAWVGR